MPSYNALPSNERIGFLYQVECGRCKLAENWSVVGQGQNKRLAFFWPANDGYKPVWLIFWFVEVCLSIFHYKAHDMLVMFP